MAAERAVFAPSKEGTSYYNATATIRRDANGRTSSVRFPIMDTDGSLKYETARPTPGATTVTVTMEIPVNWE